jgi:hypothetical protein
LGEPLGQITILFSAAARGDTQPHPILQYQLEHFRKNCSHADGEREEAVFSSFGFVSAPAFAKATARQAVTGFSNLLLRQSLAKTQKSSLRMATVFLQTL